MAWKGFRSWLEATHADDVVHMDETLRIINNLCEDVSKASLKQVIDNSNVPVHVSWNCLESKSSSSEAEMAISRHSAWLS